MTPVSLTPRQPSQAQKIADLERRLRRLETRRSLGQSTISEGDLTVKSAGRFQVIDANTGQVVAIIGALPPEFDRSDGSRQPGVAFYREDGTLGGLLGDLNPTTPPYKQAWQVFDRAGNVVMADDTNGGHGLAKPTVGGGCFFNDTNVTRWPQTTNGTFTAIADTYIYMENPRVQWDIQYTADSGTTGEVRLMCNGVQVGATQTVGVAFSLWSTFTVALPGVSVGDFPYLQLQARRTSGAGNVYAIVQRFQGDGSP
jgi:hypothetical protein